MEDNYYALYLSIIKPCTPEQALRLMEVNIPVDRKGQKVDTAEMVRLRAEGKTYSEIAAMFGISRGWACIKIQQAIKKKAEE